MKHNLSMLRDALEQIDNDPQKSMLFYNNPKMRLKFIQDVLNFSISQLDNIDNPAEMQLRYNELTTFLDINFQQYGWPAHEVHFHTNFMQHSSCPFTCLNEISTIIEKIIKEKFAA